MQLLLAAFGVLVALAAGLGVVALALAVRRLAERQQGVLHELEQLSAAQRRVLEQAHSLAHKQRVLAEKVGEVAGGAAAAGEARLEPDQKAIKEDVRFLAGQGLSADRIAKELNVPLGEVELILDLDRFGAKR